MSPSASEPFIVASWEIEQALEVIRRGGVVAFPTETYYGLAVDPFNREAVARLFVLKRRAPDKPILTLVGEREQLPQLAAQVPIVYEPLISAFWPGPLTLIFAARPDLPAALTGYTGTIGIRISSHPLAARLMAAWGGPLTATSANFSGQPAAASAPEVIAQLGPDVDYVLDGGPTAGGPGSTLVGLDNHQPLLIRAGVIPYEAIMTALAAGENQGKEGV